jgi:general secretion pathway protein G
MLLQNHQRKHTQVRRGFTLIEVLVVVAIIVILAGAGTVAYMKILEDAKKDSARTQAHQIETALEAYKIKYGEPNGINDLLHTPNGSSMIDASLERDPWGGAWSIDVTPMQNGGKPAVVATAPDGEKCANSKIYE